MSNQTCIPVPVGSPNPIIWHMDIGDRLKIQNLKYGANQQVYVTCGAQDQSFCGDHRISQMMVDWKGEVMMRGSLSSGARLAVPHSADFNTMYKKIDLVCK